MRVTFGPRSALLLLLVLPAGFNEFLTGSTPLPALLSDPVVVPFVLGFYGAGVLALRELTVRWGKGWPTLLLLGAAFGVVLEGLTAHTFFSTTNPQVGWLASYGRWAGVNWVWAVSNVLTDAVFTTAIPVLLVHQLVPGTRGKALLGRSGLTLALGSFVLFPLVANLLAPPGLPLLLATIAAVAGLVLLARRLPTSLRWPRAWVSRGGGTGPGRPALLGGLLTLSNFVLGSIIAHFVPPSVEIALLLAVNGTAGCLGVVWLRGQRVEAPARFPAGTVALAGGLLVPWFGVAAFRATHGDPFIVLPAALYAAVLLLAFRAALREGGSERAGPAAPLRTA